MDAVVFFFFFLSLCVFLFFLFNALFLAHDEKPLVKKVTKQCKWLFTNLNEKIRVFTLRLCLYVCLSSSSSSLNHGSSEMAEKNMFHGPWECVICVPFIYFFSPFPQSGHNGFCVSLLNSSRIWTFSWHLLLRKHRQKWLAYWEQPALRDEESVWFAEGLKTMMRTRALNKWDLMKCSHQDNTFFRVLHPALSVQVCRGSQRNLNLYLTVTAVLITKRARNKIRRRKRTQKYIQIERKSLRLCNHKKHHLHRHNYTFFLAEQLNWDIKHCYFLFMWSARWPLLCPGWTAPMERATRDHSVCVCVHARACACVRVYIGKSRQEASHNKAVWVSSGPQLTKRTPAVTGPSSRSTVTSYSPSTQIHTERCTDVPQGTHMTLLDTLRDEHTRRHGYTENTSRKRKYSMAIAPC